MKHFTDPIILHAIRIDVMKIIQQKTEMH